MDFNIAIVLYFASKGIGILNEMKNNGEQMLVQSNSKIVLSGWG